jgi:hypothetical protein
LILDTSSYSHPQQRKLGRNLEIQHILDAMGIEWTKSRGYVSQRISSACHTLIRLGSDHSASIRGIDWILASDGMNLSRSSPRRFSTCRHVDGYFAEAWDVPFFRASFNQVIEVMLNHRDSSLELSAKNRMDNSVAVHIRLGDMRQARPDAILSTPRIVKEVKRVAPATAPYVTVFSDEQALAVQELNRGGLRVKGSVSHGSAYKTLLALSSANHIVASASTFSWWAGILTTATGGKVSFPIVGDSQDALISIPSEWERF